MTQAQTPADPNVPGSNVPIDLIDPARELEDRLEQERREKEIRQFQSSDPLGPSIVNPEGANEGPCVVVNDIQIEGVTLLSKGDMNALLRDRFPGCLRRFQISHLMRSLDKFYVDQGYITARTYIPQQDIQKTGVLRLVVVEGVVENIVMRKNGKVLKEKDLEKLTAFPIEKGDFFNVRDFEQGLEQLNRQSSVRARMQLEPGTQSGGSVVNIEAEVKDRYRGFIGFDNLGSQSTGERQLRIQLGADGVLSANDVASLVYVGSTNANALNGALSIPVGKNTFTASASISDYLLPLSEFSELLSNTQSYTLSVDRVLSRNSRSINHLSAALRYRESERFINGVGLTPQKTTVLDVRGRHITNREKSRWSYEIGVRSGMPWLGGQTDLGPLTSDVPHAEFQAFDFAITRIGKSPKHGRWTNSLRGQYTLQALLGSEQFSLGSQSTVRGFREPILGGDIGVAMRSEGSFALPRVKSSKTYDKIRSKSEIYLFSDIGAAYSYGFEQSRLGVGVGGGYRYYGQKARFDVGFQSGIVNHTKGELKSEGVRLTMSVTYKAF